MWPFLLGIGYLGKVSFKEVGKALSGCPEAEPRTQLRTHPV